MAVKDMIWKKKERQENTLSFAISSSRTQISHGQGFSVRQIEIWVGDLDFVFFGIVEKSRN